MNTDTPNIVKSHDVNIDKDSLIPWGHHREIISKSKSVEEALFYILKTIDGNWSRDTLLNCIKDTPSATFRPR